MQLLLLQQWKCAICAGTEGVQSAAHRVTRSGTECTVLTPVSCKAEGLATGATAAPPALEVCYAGTGGVQSAAQTLNQPDTKSTVLHPVG